MQRRNARPAGTTVTTGAIGNLLGCRTAMLGLDLHALKTSDKETFDKLVAQCLSCGSRDVCTVDLKRDPNSPVWETYCPNAATIIGLTEACWLTH